MRKKGKAMKTKIKIIVFISTITLMLLMGFAVYKTKKSTQEDVGRSLNTTKIEDLEVGKNYTIDVSDNLGCIWETAMYDIGISKTKYYKMYLVPMESEENTYIGLMMRERSPFIDSKMVEIFSYFGVDLKQGASRNSSDIVGKRITGTLEEYNWIMSKKIPNKIAEQQIDSSQITIVPMYLNTIGTGSKEFIILLIIVVLIVMFLIYLYTSAKTQESFRDISREVVMYEKGIDGELIWNETALSEEEKKSNFLKYIYKYEYGNVKEEKSVYNAFKKFYGHRLCTNVFGSILAFYIIYGLFFSFNPKNWYYGFYDDGIYITIGMTLSFTIYIVYLVIVWVTNPMKKSIIKNIREKTYYSKEYLEAFFATGKLFTSTGGYIYVSKDFLIVGEALNLSIMRYDKVRKIVWCERDQKIKKNVNTVTWLRIEDENGHIANVSNNWRTALCFLKYWKKECSRFFGKI